MATDATGTPTTNFNIPKIDPTNDAPSGLGMNAMMDSIDGLFTQSPMSGSIAGIAVGSVPVWDGSEWVKPGGTPDGTKFLRDDGQWADPGGAMQLIAESAPTDDLSTAITLSSIPTTFTHLRVVFTAKSKTAATSDTLYMRFNGDSTSNYNYESLTLVNGTGPFVNTGVAVNGMWVATTVAASVGDEFASGGVIDIPNYKNAAIYKHFVSEYWALFNAASGVMRGSNGGNSQSATTAISSISFHYLLTSAAFRGNVTKFSLYGLA